LRNLSERRMSGMSECCSSDGRTGMSGMLPLCAEWPTLRPCRLKVPSSIRSLLVSHGRAGVTLRNTDDQLSHLWALGGSGGSHPGSFSLLNPGCYHRPHTGMQATVDHGRHTGVYPGEWSIPECIYPDVYQGCIPGIPS